MSGNRLTDDEIFDRLYEEEPWLRRYLSHCGIPPEDIKELMQDILITVWRKGSSLRDPSCFKPWLRKIAQRKVIRYHKILEREWTFHYSLNQLEDEWEETGMPVPKDLIHEDPENFSQTEVYQLVMELGFPASSILLLHYAYLEQFNEIADTLHINENTVRSIARRSLVKLRKTMKERGLFPYGKE